MSELREWLETIFKTLYDVPRLVAWAGVAGMAFIIWVGVTPSQPGENRYGPEPMPAPAAVPPSV